MFSGSLGYAFLKRNIGNVTNERFNNKATAGKIQVVYYCQDLEARYNLQQLAKRELRSQMGQFVTINIYI